ncbi:MAG: T9SS type A sorting domain-containing protein [Bacteroidales bacterium]|nr:T9SS type A sorting domain-containing protein [Bacteroidales bacterium]MDY0347853.1 T9SS type A sorting domain-containing protein [Tenuifilaceae bacterium]
MKKFSILIALVFGAMFTVGAQNWIEDFYSPADSKNGVNFHQLQKDFNEYWSKYDVQAGYYYVDGVKHKAGGWKQFKRWEWFWEPRVEKGTGNLPAVNPFTIQQDFLKTSKGKTEDLSDWESMGPSSSAGGYAGVGRINCITFHPSNPNIFWVGSPSGGLWKTTNGGESWEVLTDNIPVIGVSEIVLAHDYETSQTIYIATGDRDAGDNYSIGVLKTTDDGQTWDNTGLNFAVSSGYRITRLLKHPSDPNIFWASTNIGLIKTTDAWETYNVVSSGVFFDMELQPNSNGQVLFAANYSNKQIYKSTDSGQTWSGVHSLPSSYRVELAVTPANPNVVYALACDNSYGLDGVYKSTDGGNTFSQVYGDNPTDYNLLNWSINSTTPGGQGWFDLTLSVSPVNENIIYLGGINTWKSMNGGSSWGIVNFWYAGTGVPAVHADKHYMKFMDENTFFEGNDGGVYKTTNGGNTWTDLTNGMVISQMYRLGVSQTVKDEVITGLQDNGSKLTSGGDWWDVKGGDGMECIIDYTDVNVQYATYVYGQVDRTLDRWNYSRVNITESIPDHGAWVSPYIIDPIDNKTLYLGYSDVWKTQDRGNSWQKISNLNIYQDIRSMAISESNPNHLYIAGLYSFYCTTNGGESWNNLTSKLPNSINSISYITVDSSSPEHIWITYSGYELGAKVYESFDGGNTWTNISQGLPNVPANTIVENKMSGNQQLYVGTDMGVFFREDNNEWALFSNNLPTVVVTELEIHYDIGQPENSVLYASTYGRGLWKTNVAPFDIPKIALSTVKGPIYVSDNLSATFPLGYSLNETFSDNTFTAYLSDSNGDFSSAVVVGELQSDEDGSINIEIPASTASGTGYKIKMSSSSPAFESEESNSFEIILDNENPTIAISSIVGEHTYMTTFDVKVEFSEDVEGFEQSDILVTNADVNTFDSSEAPLYIVNISPIQSGPVTLCVPADVATDMAGNSNVASDEWSTIFTITSIEDLAAKGVVVYPNPSNGYVKIDFDKQIKKAIVSVYDISGKLLETQEFSDTMSEQVDLSSLSKRIYFLKINVDGKEVTTKLIIE